MYGSKNDVIGCLWDNEKGTVSFTLNGRMLGEAYSNVRGRFFPAVSTINPSASFHFNFGGEPFKWNPPIRRWSSAQVMEEAMLANRVAAKGREEHGLAISKAIQRLSRKQQLPKACSCWKYRANAQQLAEIVPGVGVGILMRVLHMTNNDPQGAAELLLANAGGLPTDEEGSSETAECRKCAHAFLYQNGQETPLDMATALFGAPVPYAPGLSGRLVIAEPANGARPLENASAVAGNIVLIRRGGCTFVEKGTQKYLSQPLYDASFRISFYLALPLHHLLCRRASGSSISP
jgi:hypothetical protein